MLLQRQFIAVGSVGENVSLQVGNWQRVMHFETALLLSWWTQKRAREARRAIGLAAGFSCSGVLHDLNNPNAGQPFNPRRVHPLNADLLRREQISIRRERQLIVLKFLNGVTKLSDARVGPVVTAWLSGGTLGQWASVTCEIVTVGSRTEDRTLYLKIRDR